MEAKLRCALSSGSHGPRCLGTSGTGVAGPDPVEDGNRVSLIFCCTAAEADPPKVVVLQA